jgi:hypothetical protein
MPRLFRFDRQRLLDYRSFQTARAWLALLRSAETAAKADEELVEARRRLEIADAQVTSRTDDYRDAQRRAWEATGDWTRTVERVGALMEQEKEVQKRIANERRLKEEASQKAQGDLAASRLRHRDQDRFQNRLEALRDEKKKEHRRKSEAAEIEEAAETITAIAWLEREKC